ncbi:hypothetical protein AVEN_235530-1 [Araneus ventricosus]|uniref:Uncharacterized protein n=1 Tax=Araneus ventricosus TaxID=182803 RepID=A0A4Y2A4J5_ARAVE|nr:hypothetical protein AVEN_235530-1 [Araneus ventricosus]
MFAEFLTKHLGVNLLASSWNRTSADMIRNDYCVTLDEKLPIVIEPPEGMLKEEYEQRMSIDGDTPVAVTLTDLEISQAISKIKR